MQKTKLKGTTRQGGRREQLMDDSKEKERILEFERKSVTSPSRDNRFGLGYGPIARQNTPRISISIVNRELGCSN
jgi:hypothetical protein